MKFFKKQKNKISVEKQTISQVVILAVVFGFAAGVVGQIFADVYIEPWQEYSDLGLTNTNQSVTDSVPELRRIKRFLGIQQDFEVEKSVSQALPAVVGIYQKKSGTGDALSQSYLPKDMVANGFILTSDGWLLTYGQLISGLNKNRLVVVYKNQELVLDQVVIDPMSGIAFVKVSANDLPVVVLGDSDENTLGQLAIAVNSLKEATVTNIKNPFYQLKATANDLIFSTEKYDQSILVESNVTNSYLGGPLLNLAGEVTGVIKEIDKAQGIVTAVPINQFRPVILGILKNHPISRPYLGVVYLDLSKTTGGALIYKKPLAKTPAAAAGLQVNDVIVSVDGQSIDSDDNLTKLIQQYQPGDEVDLEILRDGKQSVKTITLSSLPE